MNDTLPPCPECGHEWRPGSSAVVKVGKKLRGIRLVDGDHDIACKIPGIGQKGLKSQFLKKLSD